MQVFEAKEEYFIGNGAILLEKQISCNQGRDIETIRVFSAKDIQQATNNYDPHLILGTEIATVYKGNLDDKQVAIKVKGPLSLRSFEKTTRFSDSDRLLNSKRERFKVFEVESRSNRGRTVMTS